MRKLQAYMELQIATKRNEKEMIPNVGGYAVIVNGNILQFDFEDYSSTTERDGDNVTICTEQWQLDKDNYYEDWTENGLIPKDIPEEDVESRIFELIKDSASTYEIYVDIALEGKEDAFEEPIYIKSFVVVDILSGERINMLEKAIEADSLPGNVMVLCET